MRAVASLLLILPASTALTPVAPARARPGAPLSRPGASLSRRALLPLPALLAATTLHPQAAQAAELEMHTTGSYEVSYGAPAGWQITEQELQGSRYLYVAVDPSDPDSANVVLTFQPLAADFTSLGSFGTIDLVGNSLMPQCVTGAGGFAGPSTGGCSLETDGIQGKMLSTELIKGSYGYDYTIEQTGQPKRHLRTLFAVQTQEGRGIRLVTLTAQCYETRFADLAPTFKKVLESYSSALK